MNLSDISNRLTVRPNEAAALLGVSRRSIERAIATGRLRSTKAIGARLIPTVDLLCLAGINVVTPVDKVEEGLRVSEVLPY